MNRKKEESKIEFENGKHLYLYNPKEYYKESDFACLPQINHSYENAYFYSSQENEMIRKKIMVKVSKELEKKYYITSKLNLLIITLHFHPFDLEKDADKCFPPSKFADIILVGLLGFPAGKMNFFVKYCFGMIRRFGDFLNIFDYSKYLNENQLLLVLMKRDLCSQVERCKCSNIILNQIKIKKKNSFTCNSENISATKSRKSTYEIKESELNEKQKKSEEIFIEKNREDKENNAGAFGIRFSFFKSDFCFLLVDIHKDNFNDADEALRSQQLQTIIQRFLFTVDDKSSSLLNEKSVTIIGTEFPNMCKFEEKNEIKNAKNNFIFMLKKTEKTQIREADEEQILIGDFNPARNHNMCGYIECKLFTKQVDTQTAMLAFSSIANTLQLDEENCIISSVMLSPSLLDLPPIRPYESHSFSFSVINTHPTAPAPFSILCLSETRKSIIPISRVSYFHKKKQESYIFTSLSYRNKLCLRDNWNRYNHDPEYGTPESTSTHVSSLYSNSCYYSMSAAFINTSSTVNNTVFSTVLSFSSTESEICKESQKISKKSPMLSVSPSSFFASSSSLSNSVAIDGLDFGCHSQEKIHDELRSRANKMKANSFLFDNFFQQHFKNSTDEVKQKIKVDHSNCIFEKKKTQEEEEEEEKEKKECMHNLSNKCCFNVNNAFFSTSAKAPKVGNKVSDFHDSKDINKKMLSKKDVILEKWLIIEPSEGVVLCGESQEINITIFLQEAVLVPQDIAYLTLIVRLDDSGKDYFFSLSTSLLPSLYCLSIPQLSYFFSYDFIRSDNSNTALIATKRLIGKAEEEEGKKGNSQIKDKIDCYDSTEYEENNENIEYTKKNEYERDENNHTLSFRSKFPSSKQNNSFFKKDFNEEAYALKEDLTNTLGINAEKVKTIMSVVGEKIDDNVGFPTPKEIWWIFEHAYEYLKRYNSTLLKGDDHEEMHYRTYKRSSNGDDHAIKKQERNSKSKDLEFDLCFFLKSCCLFSNHIDYASYNIHGILQIDEKSAKKNDDIENNNNFKDIFLTSSQESKTLMNIEQEILFIKMCIESGIRIPCTVSLYATLLLLERWGRSSSIPLVSREFIVNLEGDEMHSICRALLLSLPTQQRNVFICVMSLMRELIKRYEENLNVCLISKMYEMKNENKDYFSKSLFSSFSTIICESNKTSCKKNCRRLPYRKISSESDIFNLEADDDEFNFIIKKERESRVHTLFRAMIEWLARWLMWDSPIDLSASIIAHFLA